MTSNIQGNQRNVDHVVTAHKQTEGGGFTVRRPLPTQGLQTFDPFLLIDELGPIHYGPGEALGAPDHPHRGFETVTYFLQGEGIHKDSAGNHGRLESGDVQWMTAGSGVVHSEMPSPRMRKEGGLMHEFQIWVNLPARLKMTAPRYQEISKEHIPSVTTIDGLAHAKIIAGEALGVKAIIDTHIPIVYQDWTLKPGADVSLDIQSDHNVGVYVFSGEVCVGPDHQFLKDGQFGILGEGLSVRLIVPANRPSEARLLLLAGVPIREPIAQGGPFVMNTEEEIQEAFADYKSGRMGRIH